jgi:PBSX family phage terminase large subunit|nr:MAG TPA: terminase large subunit [Caudoviricetes sp.]
MGPAYRDVHRAVKSGSYNQFVLAGGRGSLKSSYVSAEVILQLLQHPGIHAVVLRKVANTLRKSVFAQYQWAIDKLGLTSIFLATVSPMELTYLPTGQKILFFGTDDPSNLKSIKVPFGYIGILHFEEWDQFSGLEETRNIEQSVLRGGEIALEFKTFNPPKTRDSFANRYILQSKPGQLVHKSTYLQAPPDWLGPRFIADAEHLRDTNFPAYEHEYLGVANGSGGQVFDNLDIRIITPEEIHGFDRIYNGVDWGYYPDPWAFNQMHYDAGRRTLYIFGELTRRKAGNRETADALIEYGITGTDRITADSAEKKSVQDYREYGLDCRAAIKGPGSVDYSHKWLQSLTQIVIDPDRCPDTAAEFLNYEYDRDKSGEVISGYPDRNNHHIDAVRYAMESVWKRRGE